MAEVDIEALARGVRAADKSHVSRALNLIENRRPDIERQMAKLLAVLAEGRAAVGSPAEQPRASTSHGHRVGLTGPPGVGKSSLVAVLARELRERGKSVGVVAVDPSSMRSGGALLGDRARMAFDPQDQGLFVRSLATQGALGGLAHATHAAVEVLAAAYDIVLVETVGVGQTEIAVTHVADTVVLVVQPGSGDVLQFLKAGVMEIPDLLVVNKADHGNTASRAASDLKSALATLRQVGAGDGELDVILTSARDRQGVDKLADALARHRELLGDVGVAQRRSAGHAAWSVDWLARRVGTLGLDALGGLEETSALLSAAVRRGQPALSAAQALADKLAIALR